MCFPGDVLSQTATGHLSHVMVVSLITGRPPLWLGGGGSHAWVSSTLQMCATADAKVTSETTDKNWSQEFLHPFLSCHSQFAEDNR